MNIIKMHFQSEKDILHELNTFISGATQNTKSNPLDLSKTALSLLKTLPTARDAILEYFCSVFDIAVKNYIGRIETEIATGHVPQTSSREEATVSEIHSVLCGFVSSNPQAWAPIISIWSLELLGELSSRYAGRAHVSISAGLNEILQLWMGCRSTRTLIDITTQCLMDSDSETWMNALLDTSVKHSPNFDWVVAHVGSCFPNTVITRVLSCGLKDFCQHKSADTGRKAPKLVSVVGILGHLAGSHFADIRTALIELFKWSLQSYNTLDTELKSQKVSTVPFLLQLSAMSTTLLNAMSTNVKQTLKGDTLFRLCSYVNDWCKYFGSAKVLQELVVRLIVDCEHDAFQIIQLLLDHVHNSTQDVRHTQNAVHVAEYCRDILENVLQEIDSVVRSEANGAQTVQILTSLMADITDVHRMLLATDRLKYETATRIIMLIGKSNPTVTIRSACFLLQHSKCYDQLAMLVRLVHNQNVYGHVDNFAHILKQTLLEAKVDRFERELLLAEDDTAEQMWQNLLVLLKWEKSMQVPILRQAQFVSKAILANIMDISYQFGNSNTTSKVRHTIAEILNIAINCYPLTSLTFSPHQIFSLVNSNVNYFYLCCNERDLVVKTKGNQIVGELFTRLTIYSKSARVLALRDLLERSLFNTESLLFGAEPFDELKNDKGHELLLYKNHKHSTTMMLTQRHSSVFHSGIIGQGKRRPKAANLLSVEEIASNVDNLLNAVKSCCAIHDPDESERSPVSLESLTLVSLLLVQFVSPDVMYNGLPWPEEEFSKVSIERDLYIRRLFTKTPILWQLMRLIAVYRPVLCYCSVLLRAIAATLLHQWNSTGHGTNGYCQSLTDATVRLLDVMSVGQLLPPPLANMRDVVPYLKPQELVQLLRHCVWNYIRDHVPSPALFGCDVTGLHWRDPTVARPPPLYTDTLRIVMHRNIDRLGDQYVQLFLNIPTTD